MAGFDGQWLDRMYNNRELVPGHARHFQRWAEDSARARSDLACELDALERVQERLNRWLTELVEELNRAPLEVSYGDGVPA